MRAVASVLVAVVAACGPARAPAPDAPEVAPTARPRPDPFVLARSSTVWAIARDATHLYWADAGGIHRRPLGGPAAGPSELLTDAIADWVQVSALDVDGDRVYLSDGWTVAWVPITGGAPTSILAAAAPVVALDAAGPDVFVGLVQELVRIGADGGEPRSLAIATRLMDLAVDGDHVYWTDYGEDPGLAAIPTTGYDYHGARTATPLGSVHRVPRAGGPDQVIAADQRGPSGIALAGGRVWWTDDRGPGAQSRPIGRGGPDVISAVPADQIAVDDAGVVVRTPHGYVAERRGGALAPRLIADRDWAAADLPMVIDADWIYLVATRWPEGTGGVLAVPRQDGPIELVAPAHGVVTRVEAGDDALYWVESARDQSGRFTIARVDLAGGGREEVVAGEGWPVDLAVGGGHAYVSVDGAVMRARARGGPLRSFARGQQGVTALTVHRRHVYWLDGNALMARRRAGRGGAQVVARGTGYGGYDSGIDLVFDDEHVYTTMFGNGYTVHQIDEDGRARQIFDGTASQIYPSRDLARIGDQLYFWSSAPGGGSAVWRLVAGDAVPLWRTRPDGWIVEMTAGGEHLYVLVGFGEHWELSRITPEGEATTVLRWQQVGYDLNSFLAADDRGVYLPLDPLEGIVRIAHDAPALPDLR